MIPSVAVQKALHTELESNGYPVFEVVPSDKNKMPFITIGGIVRRNNFTKENRNRFDYTITLHGWSMGSSSLISKQVEEHIYQTVMNLEIEGFEVEIVDLSMNINLKEEETQDKIIFHSVQEFEITISKRSL